MRFGRKDTAKISIKDDDGTSQSILFRFNEPRAADYIAIRDAMAEIAPAMAAARDEEGQVDANRVDPAVAMKISDAYVKLARACAYDADGVEDADGEEVKGAAAIELLAASGDGQPILEALGLLIFGRMRRVEQATGKGEKASD